MKTIIIYEGKYTTVEKCVNYIKNTMGQETLSTKVKEIKNVNLNDYDCIILGGSLHYGKIQKELMEFIINNKKILKEKKLGLFICSGDRREKNLTESYGELASLATASAMFGGEYDFNAMNFLDKPLMKIFFGGKNKEQPHIHYDVIDEFIKKLNI